MDRLQFSGRSDQHRAALKRKADALVLRRNGRWRGAMYVLGYAVECSIKAKLMEKYGANTLEKLESALANRFSKPVDLRSHSFEYLLQFTAHRPNIDRRTAKARAVCNRWTPSWRYDPSEGTKEECDKFFDEVDVFLGYVSRSV